MAELTPMKRQYLDIKQQHPDCLLFFRLGDFYEMFDDDAKLASRELDLALTTRDRNIEDPDERTPMCGVPYHSAEAYIARLIAKGYKVAICEQMEDPALAKGLVQREVIRIITPGTVTESSMLEEGKSNYICAVHLSGERGGAAFCDLSTGEFCCASWTGDAVNHIGNELGRFAPREALLSPGAFAVDAIGTFLTQKLGALLEAGPDYFEYMPAAARVCEQFGFKDVDESGLGEDGMAVCAAGALLGYLKDTQKFDLSHIRQLDVFYGGRFMELDWATRRSLELTESLRSGEKRGSLLWVLDKTKTPMGGRMLRAWVERPLLSPVQIKRRHAAVGELAFELVKLLESFEPVEHFHLDHAAASTFDFSNVEQVERLQAFSRRILLGKGEQDTVGAAPEREPPQSGNDRTGVAEEPAKLLDAVAARLGFKAGGGFLESIFSVEARPHSRLLGVTEHRVKTAEPFSFFLF